MRSLLLDVVNGCCGRSFLDLLAPVLDFVSFLFPSRLLPLDQFVRPQTEHLVRRRECHVVGRVGDDKPLGRRVLCDRHGGIPEPIQTYAKYSVCSEGECKQLPVGSVILPELR